MAFAPPPPPMAPMQFAQGPDLGSQLQALAKAGTPLARAAGQAMSPNPIAPGSALPGAVGPTSAGGPAGPMPLAAPGTVMPTQQPSIVDAIKGMSPQQILDVLRNMSTTGQQVIPQGQPGSVALMGAGMMPSTFGG